MKTYCKCLNFELVFDRVESRPKYFDELSAEHEDCPSKCKHKMFDEQLYFLSINSPNDIVIHEDDINSRSLRSESEEKAGSLRIHAYLPKLILTHQTERWKVRECFLCHTYVMAFFTGGTIVVCPSSLYGMNNDDGLYQAQSSISAQAWMLSKSALARDNQVSDEIRYSLEARKQLESMSSVWHTAKMRAKLEMQRRIDELRRQEEASFEESVRLSSELQNQVTNSFLSLLTLRHRDPEAYEKEEKESEVRVRRSSLSNLTEDIHLMTSQPAGDMPERKREDVHKPSVLEVEMATDALDIQESDLFDDHGSPPPEPLEEWTTGRTARQEDEDLEDKFDGEELLSTSAVSSSVRAGRGMRASSRQVDDRLPDMDAFNAMTDAERAYAIERASYHCQDHRLHELYGDMEPPHLQDLRRQAEKARQTDFMSYGGSDASRHS